MKRVVQYSIDILIRNEKENGIDLEKLIAEALEEKGLYVCGVGFSEDLTEEYKDYISAMENSNTTTEESAMENYFEAIETCPHCDSENSYPMWDVNTKGYVAICEHCGKEIMLCDECLHAEDNPHMNCDWCKTECGGKCFRGITKD